MTNPFSTRHVAQSATMAMAAVMLGGMVAAGLPGTLRAASTVSAVGADRCAGGTAVSAFVCRNTWMGYSKLSAR